MNQILYFDPFNGIAGDMVIGALLDLGLPLEHLEKELAKLDLGEYRLVAERLERQGLQGTDFKVVEEARDERSHRHFSSIRKMILESELEEPVKATALKIFRKLAEAEAKVHGTSIEKVHFHEVGALDSIVDIVGAAVGFEYFGISDFFTAPLTLGKGTVHFSHGHWPVPTPATTELLVGFSTRTGEVEAELTTPTGAAIVAALVEDPAAVPPVFKLGRSGFGAGDREFSRIPNMLRLTLAEVASEAEEIAPGVEVEKVVLLEANIDDMDAEMFGYFFDRALEEGALDVTVSPLQMKKSRPGQLLSVLCRPEDQVRLSHLIFRETTTLGVRQIEHQRFVLKRRVEKVQTSFGEISVKIGTLGDEIVNVLPEYEDLKRISTEQKIPLKMVKREILEHLSKCDL